jgi:hypothetical protein
MAIKMKYKGNGILKTCKDYLKSYVSPWYVTPGLAIGAYGAACAIAGYAIPELAKRTFEGIQYVIQNFPNISLYKCFEYTFQTFSHVSCESMKEGAKGFFQFFVGSVFVMKLLSRKIGKALKRG